MHISGMEMLSKCGEQFRRRYIEKEIIPPGVALLVGTATHRSVAKNLESKMRDQKLLTLAEIKDAARDSLVNAWKDGVSLSDEEAKEGIKKVQAEAIDKAVRLSSLHAQCKAPEIEPIHIERAWTVELPNFPFDLSGQIDIQEKDRIRDTKTSGKTPAASIADESLQLTAYALAVHVIDSRAPNEVALDYLIDTKTPKAETFRSTRTIDHFKSLLRRAENAANAIEKGVFIPARESDWWCSEKFCGYALTCPYYTRKPKQFAI
jgi:RecB family exonuclease